jgi:hypothetical protein
MRFSVCSSRLETPNIPSVPLVLGGGTWVAKTGAEVEGWEGLDMGEIFSLKDHGK